MALRSSGNPPTCHRCGRLGHMARECSLHTCFRCNSRGHMAWECGEGMTCSLCDEKGHIQRNCKNVSCHKCGRKGHISKYCNDPFAKAREVERQERLAMMNQHGHRGQGESPALRWPPAPAVPSKRSVSVTSSSTGLASGPWDRLGGGGSFGFGARAAGGGGGATPSARASSFVGTQVVPVTTSSSSSPKGGAAALEVREEAGAPGATDSSSSGVSMPKVLPPPLLRVRVLAKAAAAGGVRKDGGVKLQNVGKVKDVRKGAEGGGAGHVEDSGLSPNKRKMDARNTDGGMLGKKAKDAADAGQQQVFALEQLLGYGSEEDEGEPN